MILKLDDFQERTILETAKCLAVQDSVLVQSCTGSGKCLAKDTPIIMYNGEIKMVQDIKTGDLLIGPDSKPRKVLSTCCGMEVMYKVTPVKGDSYTVNSSHILSLVLSGVNRLNGFPPGVPFNISVKNYLLQSKTFKHCAKGWRTPLNFETNFKFDLDPYYIGLWIGDGMSRHGGITVGSYDIVNYLKKFAEENNCNTRIEDNSENSVIVHFPEKNHSGAGGSKIMNFLRKHNLIMNKHIPLEFKTSSREDRIKLLAGIIDSDGHISNGCCDAIFKQKVLSEDICFLARSLGFAAYMSAQEKGCWYKGEYKSAIYYRVSISGDFSILPLIYQKAEERKQIKDVLRTGIKVEKTELDFYYGFEIDGDGLFVLGDFTVTHNTVMFSAISNRFIEKNPDKDVIIFVDRIELAGQTVRAIFKWYGIIAQVIDADTTIINPNARVFVSMVETFNNRVISSSFRNNFSKIGLAIFDEAHKSNFKKIFIHFITAKRIGFTATPVSATKKDPLKNYYHSFVKGAKIEELIELNKRDPHRGIIPCVTYGLGSIKQSNLKTKGDDFDEDYMGKEFSNDRQIQNVISAYLKYGYARKTICFNANIEHSVKMHEAFLKAGLNSRHLNSTTSKKEYKKYGTDEWREDCFKWLKENPDAILNNVGIATTGFDEPSIETVISNFSTKSISKIHQVWGRGARPYRYPNGSYMDYFLVLDMGDNASPDGGNFGQWTDEPDWEALFWNPKIPNPGIPVVKTCPICGGMNTGSARFCKALRYDFILNENIECGFQFPINEKKEDTVEREMIRIGTLNIDVSKTVEYFRHKNEYNGYYETIKQVALQYRSTLPALYLDSEHLAGMIQACYQKVCEWYKVVGKKRFPAMKDDMKIKFLSELKNLGFIIMSSELEEIK